MLDDAILEASRLLASLRQLRRGDKRMSYALLSALERIATGE